MHVNQNPGLLTLASLFLREHNRQANLYVQANPSATDEQVFQHARKWTVAQVRGADSGK